MGLRGCFNRSTLRLSTSFLLQKNNRSILKEEPEGLTVSRPMFPSYKNQSVDFQSKSTDGFLFDGNIGR